MIKSRKEYKEFLASDRQANHVKNWLQSHSKVGWRHLKKVRRLEYVINCKSSFFSRLEIFFLKYIVLQSTIKTGIVVPPNTFGKGLFLPHFGSIIINHTARFGNNCVVQNGVNVSENVVGGNHLYIGAGAKIMSNVHIADDVIIGANSVVTKDILEPNVVVAGVPARIISHNGFKNRTSI